MGISIYIFQHFSCPPTVVDPLNFARVIFRCNVLPPMGLGRSGGFCNPRGTDRFLKKGGGKFWPKFSAESIEETLNLSLYIFTERFLD
jgi:hypothetical protein